MASRKGVVKNEAFRSTLLGVEVGPFRRRFEQGWFPPETVRDDDCMRASFCCVTGIHPFQIPWIAPDRDNCDFFPLYRKLAAICGFHWEERVRITDSERKKRGRWPFTDDELWIAGVGRTGDGRGRGTAHAIVMQGQNLYWDCNSNHPRRRRPTRVGWGARLNPLI